MSARIRAVNAAPVREAGSYVLYWMIGARRLGWSHALDRAVALCRELRRPLLILEPLRVGHRWASARFHRLVVDGMAEHAADLRDRGIAYHAYVEPAPGAGKGLLGALAAHAAAVVTDDVPWFFLPRMIQAAGRQCPVRLEAVDSIGLVPFRATEKEFLTAHSFRRYLQRTLPEDLLDVPTADPLGDPVLRGAKIPSEILARWPSDLAIAGLPIDHGVGPVATRGGTRPGRERLVTFLADKLPRYEERNHPDADVNSGLSPYLHWGFVSPHEVAARLFEDRGWTPDRLGSERSGTRDGFWNISPEADAFLDQLVTWRELGSNLTAHRPDADRASVLPAWALAALRKHQDDPRPALLDLRALEAAETPDPLWNAAQRELTATGTIHNAVRMIWGKRVLEWTATPEDAFDALIHLNDRWAIDGRDGNSYTGISWALGRFDRPWGPERPIFGTVRYMSSTNSAKKWRLKQYLARWSV